MQAKPGTLCLSIIAATALLGCNATTPVKEVTTDQKGYLHSKFAQETVPAGIAAMVPADRDARIPYGELKIALNAEFEKSNGEKESAKIVTTFARTKNGLVQRLMEYSNNDIPYAIYYALTYKGLIDLRWQDVPVRRTVSGPLTELKQVTRFDPTPTAANQEFSVHFTSGHIAQIANYNDSQKTCKSVAVSPASQIHAKLAGQAIHFECDLRTNNVVSSKSKFVLLQDYGVAIGLELSGSASRARHKVTDVSIIE